MVDLSRLRSVLTEARVQGLLGDQPIDAQMEHSQGFLDALALSSGGIRGSIVDLGGGGGVPGLVVASTLPEGLGCRVVLLEGSVRRADWLRHAVELLDLAATVQVLAARAEVAGHLAEHRHQYDAVTARSFGRPGVVAECGAALLKVGGLLVVSEPPPAEVTPPKVASPQSRAGAGLRRWPEDGLAELGFSEAVEVRFRQFGYVIIRSERLCPERYPRRTGIPAKRPLF